MPLHPDASLPGHADFEYPTLLAEWIADSAPKGVATDMATMMVVVHGIKVEEGIKAIMTIADVKEVKDKF